MATGSDTNFIYTVNSADPENPLFGARISMISHTRKAKYSRFSDKIYQFLLKLQQGWD